MRSGSGELLLMSLLPCFAAALNLTRARDPRSRRSSYGAQRGRRRQPGWTECECDGHGAEADRKGAGVEPAVARKLIKDPPAHQRADRHAECRSEGGCAESRTHDARTEILADQDGIEGHNSAIRN